MSVRIHPRRKPPVFIDLDETLVYAQESPDAVCSRPTMRIGGYQVVVRPEAHEILTICREGGREVYLFTMATFGFALATSQTCGLGFDERSIFSLAMILNCRRGLSPRAALIDNLATDCEPTQLKLTAIGAPPENLWKIPTFSPPRFASARLFMAGLPYRLSRLDKNS